MVEQGRSLLTHPGAPGEQGGPGVAGVCPQRALGKPPLRPLALCPGLLERTDKQTNILLSNIKYPGSSATARSLSHYVD